VATFLVGDPVTADALNAIADAPYCSLVQATAQNLTSASDTALTFGTGSTVSDLLGFHSEVTNTTRITPTVAGLYRFEMLFFVAAVAAQTFPLLQVALYKNGVVVTGRLRTTGSASTGISTSAIHTMEAEANGSTDYFEMFCQQICSSAATRATNVGGSFTSTFTATRVRSLLV
jgi:hypothetical protein